MPFHAAAASAKGAVEGLTRALAAELAPGIRVNAIAPTADWRLFGLDAERLEAFMAALDGPPRPLPCLERLFGTPSIFEDNGTLP